MERTYTIPLRRGTMLAPRTRRAKKAVNVLKEYLVKHLKTDQIKLSEKLNETIWQNGIRNPVMKVTVTAVKDEKGVAFVRLSTEDKSVFGTTEQKVEPKKAKAQQKVVEAKATDVTPEKKE
jgi:large subunit ribosomal protein L31e